MGLFIRRAKKLRVVMWWRSISILEASSGAGKWSLYRAGCSNVVLADGFDAFLEPKPLKPLNDVVDGRGLGVEGWR